MKKIIPGIILLLFIWLVTILAMKNPEKISSSGIESLMKIEKLSLKSYRDSGGVLTIGYGHTSKTVRANMTITKKRALELLKQDLKVAEQGVFNSLHVKTSQKQYDSMVSLAYNIGVRRFRTSTLIKYHNKNRFSKTSKEFLKWDKIHGKSYIGLYKRRIDEQKQYDDGSYFIYSLYNLIFVWN
ncbi:MAG: lysozyme [Psychrilyobacter sp.]|nr:lysozyme [Psychrilyobacter sp.]